MKTHLKYWSIAAVLGISLFDFMGTSKVEAAEVKASSLIETKTLSQEEIDAKKEEIASQIKIFDENNKEIHPYTTEQLKNMIRLTEEQPTDNPIKVLKKHIQQDTSILALTFGSVVDQEAMEKLIKIQVPSS